MDDAFGMQICKTVEHMRRVSAHDGLAQRTEMPEQMRDASVRTELEEDVQARALPLRAQEPHDVRMGQASKQIDLRLELPHAVRPMLVLLPPDAPGNVHLLHGEDVSRDMVQGLVDFAEASSPQDLSLLPAVVGHFLHGHWLHALSPRFGGQRLPLRARWRRWWGGRLVRIVDRAQEKPQSRRSWPVSGGLLSMELISEGVAEITAAAHCNQVAFLVAILDPQVGQLRVVLLQPSAEVAEMGVHGHRHRPNLAGGCNQLDADHVVVLLAAEGRVGRLLRGIRAGLSRVLRGGHRHGVLVERCRGSSWLHACHGYGGAQWGVQRRFWSARSSG
eukprot:scaffold8299_cov239-Pinguiococcus_pyrenoidosus.AAC.1